MVYYILFSIAAQVSVFVVVVVVAVVWQGKGGGKNRGQGSSSVPLQVWFLRVVTESTAQISEMYSYYGWENFHFHFFHFYTKSTFTQREVNSLKCLVWIRWNIIRMCPYCRWMWELKRTMWEVLPNYNTSNGSFTCPSHKNLVFILAPNHHKPLF